MTISLGKNAYGKNAINLSKIIRNGDIHDIKQISVNVALKGDFDTAHTLGDNSKILPTDTMKNTVYILAKEYFTDSIEGFGIHLANHFFSNNAQVDEVKIELTEYFWQRMEFDGTPHPHSFVNGGSEKHIATIIQDANSVTVTSGIKDLLVLKTTKSGFEGYIKDAFTTLPETSDRIFSTQCEAIWLHESNEIDFTKSYAAARNILLKTFSEHHSLSVQQTLYAMGEAVLQQDSAIVEISLVMPNKHHILFNMQPFGMENKNEVFMATDEPFGYITGTVKR
jgi:urate oxidase